MVDKNVQSAQERVARRLATVKVVVDLLNHELDVAKADKAISLERERGLGRDLIGRLEVTPAAESRLVGLLSGGNQQKIVIARWLFAGARVFVLDEPTQGIDVEGTLAGGEERRVAETARATVNRVT